MKAIDTNILARFFIDDADDEQAVKQRPKAIEILSQPVYVPVTVILEFEWVMRGFYRLDRVDILQVYRTLLGFTHVQVEDYARVLQALDYYTQGLDFADSLHAVRAQEYQAFVTFDAKFAKKAKNLDGLTVELV